jgi:nucleoside-diphosphate-sugar epimerase
VAGIYGPGRLPVERLLAGEPVLDEQAGHWSNRVHIDDLAAITWAAASQDWPQSLYNVCDGRPTSHAAYLDSLAELLGAVPPPRISWAEAERRFSAARLSFLRESRRLSNNRLLTETGFRFSFPDYRDGLAAALLSDPRAPSSW